MQGVGGKESGISIVLEETKLEEHIAAADLVIMGEGRLDGQTIMGKAPIGVARLAQTNMKNRRKKVNRRDFIRHSAGCLLGLMAGGWFMTGAKTACAEPMVYKRFFRFTEYLEREGTEFIVIHHTGFPDVDKDSTAADIHKYHQEHNQWAGIGYHYLIRKDGTIEQGRQPGKVGAHAFGHNGKSLGICLAGNFEIGRPTEAQMQAVKELCLWLCDKYGLDPMKKGVIVGHRDVNDTLCPGRHLYKHLGEIRRFCRDRGRAASRLH